MCSCQAQGVDREDRALRRFPLQSKPGRSEGLPRAHSRPTATLVERRPWPEAALLVLAQWPVPVIAGVPVRCPAVRFSASRLAGWGRMQQVRAAPAALRSRAAEWLVATDRSLMPVWR